MIILTRFALANNLSVTIRHQIQKTFLQRLSYHLHAQMVLVMTCTYISPVLCKYWTNVHVFVSKFLQLSNTVYFVDRFTNIGVVQRLHRIGVISTQNRNRVNVPSTWSKMRLYPKFTANEIFKAAFYSKSMAHYIDPEFMYTLCQYSSVENIFD